MASLLTESEWFMRFMTGHRSMIGECRNQDTEISIVLMIEMQQLLELKY